MTSRRHHWFGIDHAWIGRIYAINRAAIDFGRNVMAAVCTPTSLRSLRALIGNAANVRIGLT